MFYPVFRRGFVIASAITLRPARVSGVTERRHRDSQRPKENKADGSFLRRLCNQSRNLVAPLRDFNHCPVSITFLPPLAA